MAQLHVEEIDPAEIPVVRLPDDVRASLPGLKARVKRYHGTKVPLAWFPTPWVTSKCADRFGYMSSSAVRNATRAPVQRHQPGAAGAVGRHDGRPRSRAEPGVAEPGPRRRLLAARGVTSTSGSSSTTTSRSTCPRRSTSPTDAEHHQQHAQRRRSTWTPSTAAARRSTRSCTRFPTSGPPTAIKLQLGSNTNTGPGGPGGAGTPAGMQVQSTSTSRACTIRRSGASTHRGHRRPAQRREPDRRAVPPRDAAVPQRGRRHAGRGRLHRRHLRRGQADRHPPLPVGGRARLSQARLRGRGRHRRRSPRVDGADRTARSACRSSSRSPRIASATA